MSLDTLYYTLGKSSQKIVLTEKVLAHISNYRQIGKRFEAGGQLFGHLVDNEVFVTLATGPYPEDFRSRYSFKPCRKREKQDIAFFFRGGLHYIGDWHTHPEPIPKPSARDVDSMEDCFVKSKHQHGAFLLVILGTAPTPAGISLTLHNSSGHKALICIEK